MRDFLHVLFLGLGQARYFYLSKAGNNIQRRQVISQNKAIVTNMNNMKSILGAYFAVLVMIEWIEDGTWSFLSFCMSQITTTIVLHIITLV